MKTNSAIITPILGAGSTTSPFYYQVNVSQKLCTPSCPSTTPIFAPSFQVQSISQVGTGQYMVAVLLQGVITYSPCTGNSCSAKSLPISQVFDLPIAASAAPTSVTIAAGVPVNTVETSGCQKCSSQFVSEIPITVTVA